MNAPYANYNPVLCTADFQLDGRHYRGSGIHNYRTPCIISSGSLTCTPATLSGVPALA